jgi:hypothetical protein
VKKAVLTFVLLAACGSTPAANQDLLREAKTSIGKELGSPASAEFRNVRIVADTGSAITGKFLGSVCGDVRAGGDQVVDAPFRRFIYSRMNDLSAVESEPSDDPEIRDAPETKAFQRGFDDFWNEFCVTP